MSNHETEQKSEELQPTKAPILPSAQSGVATPFAAHLPKHHKRSVGLRLFDVLLYPIITNIGVFAVSVGLTYLSQHGGDRGADGKLLFGKIGDVIHKRTSPIRNFFQKTLGCSEKSASDYTTVAFSFIDGTFFAPLVKLIEDRREKIAHWIDDRLGTTKDESVYEAEPKQTWGSVVMGRVITSAVVVPTALVLDKKGWNDKMFTEPGEKLAAAIERSPKIRALIPKKVNLPYVSKVMAFEAFYTSVCTAGLYFLSRFIARRHDNKPEATIDPAAFPATLSTPSLIAPAEEKDLSQPQTRISHAMHENRLIAPEGHHLTA